MIFRSLDIVFSFCGLVILSPFFLIIFLLGILDTGSPFFIQQRVGIEKKPFNLIKFRTMSIETENVASHLASPANITKLGSVLRKTKLDELPQLINVLLGSMSFVGPRPNLFNQLDLINHRSTKGVYKVRPGITGLAQINNIDMSTPELLAKIDDEMIQDMSLVNYFKYIVKTVTGSGSGDAI
jgi:lipopolysaccharide/colanic/teichoic acid biosynthesis glycosyltransferase